MNPSNAVVNDDGADSNVVVVDDTSGAKQEVSWGVVQGLYNQLTGKREELGITKAEAFVIGLSDLTQLHHKITHAIEPFTVRSQSESVTVFFTDDDKERFSSFDRFSALNIGSKRKTESVLLQYEFAVTPSKSRELQSYKISIRLVSRAALTQKMRSQMAGVPASFLRLLQGGSVVVTITYVDYALARSIKSAIDEWIGTLDERKLSKWTTLLQRHSHQVPRVMGALALTVGVFSAYSAVPMFVPNPQPNYQTLVRFSLLCVALIVGGVQLARWIGDFAEEALDAISPCSAIILTDGDEKLAALHEKAAKSSVRTSIFTGICSGVASVLTKFGLTLLAIFHVP